METTIDNIVEEEKISLEASERNPFESEEEESEPWSSYAFGLVSSTLLSCV